MNSRIPALLAILSLGALTSSALAERNYIAWQTRSGADVNSSYVAVASTVTRVGHVAVAGYNDLLQNDTWQVFSYDSLSGNLRWSMSKSNAFGDVRPTAIASDSSGHIYVAGYTQGNSHDFLLIKYDADDGHELWTKTYNNASTNGSDEITAMAVDAYDNVVVTGGSYNNGSEDFYTIKYNSGGGVAWEKRYATSFLDRPVALAIGPSSEVVVVGRSRTFDLSCYTTIKYDSAGNQQAPLNYETVNDDIPSDVVVDSNGNIYVTGTVRIASVPKFVIHTVKYGVNPWTRTYDAPGENMDWAPKIALDSNEQPVMACTAKLDSKRTVFRAAKYNSTTGVQFWSYDTALLAGRPTDSMSDTLVDMMVDSVGDTIVTGYTTTASGGTDYLTVKFSGVDEAILWKQQLNGDATSGADKAAGLALSSGGDVIVTGVMDRGDQSPYYHIGTVRYNRMALSKGDRVTGAGLTPAAVINSLGSPAVTDNGYITTKITIKDGAKILNAILKNQNENRAEVIQGQTPPGVPGAKFTSFSDPVPFGQGYAFTGTMTGAPTGQTTGLWATNNNDVLTLVLQAGKQAPSLPQGVLVSSVVNFCPGHQCVVALVSLKGTGINTTNNTAVIRWKVSDSSTVLVMRTGAGYMIGGKASTVKTIGIFSPPVGSAGQGRYVSGDDIVMKLTMANGINAIATMRTSTNTLYPQAYSTGPADLVAAGATWLSFTQPGLSSSGSHHALLATLKTGTGAVTTANDTVIVTADNASTSFTTLAREGSAAKVIANASYATLGVPVPGPFGWYAFQATIKGAGITTANNSAIYVGGSAATMFPVARTGSPAPDAWGADTSVQYASFKSLAMHLQPIFISTLKGPGVTTKNNMALFGRDRSNYVRRLLRTGDKLGDLTVKSFTLLTPAPKAMSASRSFNNRGALTALVTFTNLSQSIIRIDIP